MKKPILWSFSIGMYLWIMGGTTWGVFDSPTMVTLSQPVHFLTPEGEDVIVNPGSYEVGAAGSTIRLQSPDIKHPILIQAEPAPFAEDVDSPVAMAIPIPEERIYVALVIPNEVGLEAIGAYSGIHARGTNFLQTRKTLSEQQRSRLKAFSGQLRKNPNTPDLQSHWKELIQEGQGQTSSISSSDINAFIQFVLRQSYLEHTKDLQYFASKIKYFNEQKNQVREEIQKTRRKLAQAPEAKEDGEKMKEKMEASLQTLKDLENQENQMNFEIQNLRSRYNQAEQTANSILKKKRDTDSSTIRNIH